jgi:hypothetical protein
MEAIPDVGQHAETILSELGYSAGTIHAWRAAGVV